MVKMAPGKKPLSMAVEEMYEGKVKLMGENTSQDELTELDELVDLEEMEDEVAAISEEEDL